MDWSRDGARWPNREASRFVDAGGVRWHVQIAGSGPPLLLVHGTAAATHSWRDVLPLLSARFTVVAPDLPGHGFTTPPPYAAGWSLPGMAAALSRLLAALGVAPAAAAGHSAGAAILIAAALDGGIVPRRIVALNGALLPFGGVGRHLFPTLAKIMFLNPLTPAVMAWRAGREGVVARLLEGTGSRIDRGGLALYERLLSDRGHVGAALSMMANWDLEALERRLPALAVPLSLVVGRGDRAVPPAVAERARALVPQAEVIAMDGVGHLAHEERPADVARVIAGLVS